MSSFSIIEEHISILPEEDRRNKRANNMSRLSTKGIKIFKTCNLYLCFIVLGMCIAVPGPTLLDLQNLVNTDTKNIAFIYTARSLGYLLGSLTGGVVFDLLSKKQFVMTIFSLLSSVTMLAIPWSRSIGILTIWMVGNGFSLGVVDTGGNVCCLNLWGKDSGPFFQALHFFFGVGGLIAPLIAAPFIGDHTVAAENQNVTLKNSSFHSSLLLQSDALNNSSLFPSNIPPVTYAYTIIGCFAFLVTILFLIVCILAPTDESAHQSDDAQIRKRSKAFIFVLIFFPFVLMFVETGVEIGYAQMLATYCVKGALKLSAVTGSYMTSGFWAAFTVSRLLSVFLAIKVSSFTLIIMDLAITSLGSVILLFLGASAEWALWLATVLLGIGIASFFPAAVGWVERYITITNKTAATFTVGAAFGEMVVPYTISYFIDYEPKVLLYIVPASTALSACIVLIMFLILRNKQEKYMKDEGTSNATCEPDANL